MDRRYPPLDPRSHSPGRPAAPAMEAAEQAKQRASNHFSKHPGFAESLIPVWGSGRETIADLYDHDYGGAALNGALTATDLIGAGSVLKAATKVAAKGGLTGGFYGLREAERTSKAATGAFDWGDKVRPWMGNKGYLQPKQHGHHWLIPNKEGFGKHVPDWLKNQPWNIKAMPLDKPQIHGRMHGSYKGQGEFNALEKAWYGTPAWAKATAVGAIGDTGGTIKGQADRKK